MPRDPFERVKADILCLRLEIEPCIAQILKKEKISNSDRLWLDHNRNPVDEKRVVELLEKASLKRGQTENAKQEKLSENSKVNKMLELWVYKVLCDGIDLTEDMLRVK